MLVDARRVGAPFAGGAYEERALDRIVDVDQWADGTRLIRGEGG
jgi:hypothetical protein